MTSLSLQHQFMTLAVRGSTRDVFDPERRIEHIPFKWRGISIRIMYTPNAYGSPASIYHFSRLEVQSDSRMPLPITDTGYKSQTLPGGSIEAAGGARRLCRAVAGAGRAIERVARHGSRAQAGDPVLSINPR